MKKPSAAWVSDTSIGARILLLCLCAALLVACGASATSSRAVTAPTRAPEVAARGVIRVYPSGSLTLDGRPIAEADLATEPPQDGSPGAVVPPERRARIQMDESAIERFFPDEARDEGASGRVRLRVTVEADARISAAEPLDDPGFGFARAAQAALLSNAATASPARDADGRPVRSVVQFAINFQLVADPDPPPRPPAASPRR